MPIITFVARVSDGMLLVASMESIGDANGNLDTYKQQAKQIMKRLDQRSPTKCSIESGAYTFHYLIQEGVCYLTLADRGFPKRLAFLYLEEVHAGFVEELERDSGSNWRDVVTTVARPYAFIKFGKKASFLLVALVVHKYCDTTDKFIQKKRKEYADPSSSQNMHRLNDDLADIHNIMRKNIQEVLNRGERVERMFQMLLGKARLLLTILSLGGCCACCQMFRVSRRTWRTDQRTSSGGPRSCGCRPSTANTAPSSLSRSSCCSLFTPSSFRLGNSRVPEVEQWCCSAY
ncbi:hypothetical protein F444_03745 [Phytophthora nicotianae P1976]|uniref:Longin domain-containing protein n=1 Tax=Phytophthora nicotianae P1976 TaxID=1317066 RepID=A0A081AT32_PHYNI|nr:hypothetical protein F444_03745 [Phytophthora nicotianae P1976]